MASPEAALNSALDTFLVAMVPTQQDTIQEL